MTLLTVATDFNNPIGIDYHAPSDRVALSVNYPEGEPYNFELVGADGSKERFSGAAGWQNEVKIATVREGPCTAGFEVGDLFTGTGQPGVIARIAADGARFWSRWVQLPGETGLMRGSLHHDRACIVDGDLLAATTTGGVWRIDAGRRAVRIAQLDTHLEGMTTVPDDPDRYGPWAGRILVGAEDVRTVFSVGLDRSVESWSLGIGPEDIDIVPPGQHFYGVDYGARRLVRADAWEWRDKVGDVVMAEESGVLHDVRWNSATGSFDVVPLASVSQWEHTTFAPVAVFAPTPTPTETAVPSATPTVTPAPPTPTTIVTPEPRPIFLPAAPVSRCRPQHADVALVLDASTSMLAEASTGRSKMEEALNAAGSFLELLHMPGDRAALVWFNEGAGIAQPLTGNRDALLQALREVENREFTRIDLGLEQGMVALEAALADPVRQPSLVLLTDGRSNPVPPERAIEAAVVARGRGIQIYAIGLGLDVDTTTLRGITGEPSRVRLAPDAAELARIYEGIAAELTCAEASAPSFIP